MARSKLKRRYDLDRNTINFEDYKKNVIFVSIFNVKVNKKPFNNIDDKNVTDNKTFWKTIRPKFLNKCKTSNAIILVENQKNLTGRKSHCKHFH